VPETAIISDVVPSKSCGTVAVALRAKVLHPSKSSGAILSADARRADDQGMVESLVSAETAVAVTARPKGAAMDHQVSLLSSLSGHSEQCCNLGVTGCPEPSAGPKAVSRVRCFDEVATPLVVVSSSIRGKQVTNIGANDDKLANLAPWQLLKHEYVLLECGVLFFAQMLRAVLDALVPLAMYETSTWLVGMVYLGGAAGAVLAPFALDQLLNKAGAKFNTRNLELVTVVVMSLLGASVLLVHKSLSGALVLCLAFCSMHSMTEALAFKHVLDYIASDQPVLMTAAMCLFSLFYVLGFTVGALISGAPSPVLVYQQQLAAAAIAAVNLLYITVVHMLIKTGIVAGVRKLQ
jgi:hypothetical protein